MLSKFTSYAEQQDTGAEVRCGHFSLHCNVMQVSEELLDRTIIDRSEFKDLIIENIVLIARALRHQVQ